MASWPLSCRQEPSQSTVQLRRCGSVPTASKVCPSERTGLLLRKRSRVGVGIGETVDRARRVSLDHIEWSGAYGESRVPCTQWSSRCLASGARYHGRVACSVHRLDEAVDDPVVEFLAYRVYSLTVVASVFRRALRLFVARW